MEEFWNPKGLLYLIGCNELTVSMNNAIGREKKNEFIIQHIPSASQCNPSLPAFPKQFKGLVNINWFRKYRYQEPFITILIIDRRDKSCIVDDLVQTIMAESKMLKYVYY